MKPITIVLTEAQLQALSSLIDAGLRAGGLSVMPAVQMVTPAIEAGVAKALEVDAE